jgi:hypothetical protein
MKNIIFNVYYISKKFGRPNKKDGVTFLVKKNTRRKEWRKEKEEILTAMEVPILCVFSIGWECPWPTALVPPSLRRTHSYGNLPPLQQARLS